MCKIIGGSGRREGKTVPKKIYMENRPKSSNRKGKICKILGRTGRREGKTVPKKIYMENRPKSSNKKGNVCKICKVLGGSGRRA